MVRTFFTRAKRERYVTLLGNPKRRQTVLNALDHFHDLDPRYIIDATSRFDILMLLRSKGAPNDCHIISNVPELDGRDMPLAQAVEMADLGRWGTLIGCIPGRLAYYHGEDGEARLLLVKE